MADIQLKDRFGIPQAFRGVEQLMVPSQGSTDAEPIWVPYTKGEAVSKTVEPDFSAGDMAVPIADGELVTELTIIKPDELVPENIAEGVDIAGIIGTLAAGANVKIAIGSFSSPSYIYAYTITHDLGTIPDIIVCIRENRNTSSGYVNFTAGFSAAFNKLIGNNYGVVTITATSSWVYTNTLDNNTVDLYINNVNDKTATICGNSSAAVRNGTYNWFAISGLTAL